MSDAIEFIGPRSHAERRYRIPPHLHARLEHEAALQGISPRSFLIRAVGRVVYRPQEWPWT